MDSVNYALLKKRGTGFDRIITAALVFCAEKEDREKPVSKLIPLSLRGQIIFHKVQIRNLNQNIKGLWLWLLIRLLIPAIVLFKLT